MYDQVMIESKADRGQDGSRPAAEPGDDRAVVMEDLLIEDVSIDGMCGVY